MVAKLMKHELRAIFRILGFLFIAVVGFAVAGRISVAAELAAGPHADGIVSELFIAFWMFSIVLVVAFAYGLGCARFTSTLYSGEAYMALSVPATAAQLVWAKLLSALVAVLCTGAVCVLSLSIFFIGWDARLFGLALGDLGEYVAEFFRSEPLLAAEGILEGIALLPLPLLFVYAIVAVGQLSTSHRKSAAFWLAFAVFFVADLIATLCVAPALEMLSVYGFVDLAVWIRIVLYALLDATAFLIAHYIVKYKVNLIS